MKRRIAPHIPSHIRLHVHSVARYLQRPEGETGAQLVMAALDDFPTLNRLAPYLWRDYAHGVHAWVGHRKHADLDELVSPPGIPLERLTMRFDDDDYAAIDALGFALGRPVAHATAVLLRFSYDFTRLTLQVAPDYTPDSPYRMERVQRGMV